MKFEFSDDQEVMRAEARRFLQKECSSAVVRRVFETGDSHHAELWQAISNLGWIGVALPERYGGLGAGYLELCVLAEEIGRALAPVPFASTVYLAAEAILRFGDESQKGRWLPRLAGGKAIGALALAEGPGSPALSRLTVRARTLEGSVVLSGVKWPVLDGLSANVAIVAANSAEGFGLYLVDLDQQGVQRTPEPGIDDGRPLARLTFEDARAEPLDAGEDGLRAILDRAAVLMAFEQLGGAQACLEMGVAYAKERYAFGRPIGSFQAIKHRLADLYAELELARSNCFYGAWALATDDAGLAEAAACARLSASQAYFNCAKESIQVHGGMGFTWDLDAHLYYRRATLLGVVLGGRAAWRDRLVRLLQARNASEDNRAARIA